MSRARREAEQIVSTARTQAESLGTTAQAEAQRELASIRAEVDRIGKRRDAITAQLASLRDVVAGFTTDDSDDDRADT